MKNLCCLLFAVIIASDVMSQNFTKITEGSIVTNGGASMSASWGDYDNDGDEDLFVGNNAEENFLYENNGDGTFTQITSGDVVNNWGATLSAAWGDYDNDGFLDLYTTQYSYYNLFYRNGANGSFDLIIDRPEVWSGNQACTWGDYDNDGDIDLFVATDVSYNDEDTVPNNALFNNNGNGTFTEVLTGPLVTDSGASRNANWVDIDDDNDLDLFVANYDEVNFLYINEGSGNFIKVTTGDIATDVEKSMSSSWADYDNNGLPDLFVANRGTNSLYRNDGNGIFTKTIAGDLGTDSRFSEGSAWGDYDNDGDMDLYVTDFWGSNNPYQKSSNSLFQNNADGTFTSIVAITSVLDSVAARGTSWADYDNDGDLDLFVAVQGANNLLYRNEGNANNFISVKIRGSMGNNFGIGTKVSVRAEIGGTSVVQVKRIRSQTGKGGQNSYPLEFGLGDATTINEILIRWPSGAVTSLADVAVNQFITIDNAGPDIGLLNQPQFFSEDTHTPDKFEAVIEDQAGVSEVTFNYRTITAGKDDPWTVIDATLGDLANRYELMLDASYFDELGVNMFVRAEDGLGNVTISDTVFIYHEFDRTDTSLEGIKTGTAVEDYQIFSIPINLDQNSVESVFLYDLGTYDKEKWRLFHYRNGENRELGNGLSNISRGKGYWLLATEAPSSIRAGAGDNSLVRNSPFAIHLDQGWNQIGNPYGFNIAWQDVLDHNPLVSNELSNFFIYSGGGYETSDRILKYQGGFVEATSATTLYIPFLKNTSVQGRTITRTTDNNNPIDSDSWQLALTLTTGRIQNRLGGIGMEPDAKLSKDKFDILTPPRFIQHLEMNFGHPEYRQKNFSKDVVPTQDGYKWQFNIDTNIADAADLTISWDNTYFGENTKEIVLFDHYLQRKINMREVSSYTIGRSGINRFEIIYGDKEFIEDTLLPSRVTLGKSYPNPFGDVINIPFTLSDGPSYHVEVILYDLKGEKVNTILNSTLKSGFHTVQWVGENDAGQTLNKGLYMLRLIVNGNNGREEYTTRISKK